MAKGNMDLMEAIIFVAAYVLFAPNGFMGDLLKVNIVDKIPGVKDNQMLLAVTFGIIFYVVVKYGLPMIEGAKSKFGAHMYGEEEEYED